MTTQEHEWLLHLIADPPPGSKLAAAKEFGIDLTLLVESLRRTPEERIRVWLSALAFHDELRRAVELARKS
jgi:hypothetical protein